MASSTLQATTIPHESRPPAPPQLSVMKCCTTVSPSPASPPPTILHKHPGWLRLWESSFLCWLFLLFLGITCFLFNSWPHFVFLFRFTPHEFVDFTPIEENITTYFFILKPNLLNTFHFTLFTEGVTAYVGVFQVLAVTVNIYTPGPWACWRFKVTIRVQTPPMQSGLGRSPTFKLP